MRVLIAPDKFKGSLSATAVAGADYFVDLLGFHRRLRDVDLIITGEGRLDHQMLTGKLPAVVAHRSSPTPVAAVVGRNDLYRLTSLFTDIHAVADHSETDAANDPQRTSTCLQQVGTHIGKHLINLTDRPLGRECRLCTDTAGSIRACREPHHVYPGALTFRRQTG